jgi:hypothetical protein
VPAGLPSRGRWRVECRTTWRELDLRLARMARGAGVPRLFVGHASERGLAEAAIGTLLSSPDLLAELPSVCAFRLCLAIFVFRFTGRGERLVRAPSSSATPALNTWTSRQLSGPLCPGPEYRHATCFENSRLD